MFKTKQAVKTSALALLAVAMMACGGGERPAGEQTAARTKPLTIKGSDTMVILGQRFAEEYMKAHPGAVVQVNGGGSGTGIAALINGTVDLAQASRPMKDEEKASVQQNRGAGVVETPVAIDALAVFVSASNPVAALTIAQVKDIFQGKVKNWKDVGGADAPVIIYGRESSSGTYDYFKEHVLDGEDFSPTVQTLQGTAAIINAVGKDANGIGYGGIAYASDVKLLPVSADGKPAVAPNEEAVAAGTYPLARYLYFYYPDNASQELRDFVTFATSAEGQSVVSKVGYFPLSDAAGSLVTGTAPTETAAGTPAPGDGQ